MPTVADSGAKLTVKSLRAHIGEEYLRDCALRKAEGRPILPNPLQHTDNKTTKKYYARKGIDDAYDIMEQVHLRKLAADADAKKEKDR